MRELKGFIIGVILTFAIGVTANEVWKQIDVQTNSIKVVVNGSKIEVDNFLYNDTTYIPLRSVSTALGQKVSYDEATSTAYIGEKENKQVNSIETKITVDGIETSNYINDNSKYCVDRSAIMGKYNGAYDFAKVGTNNYNFVAKIDREVKIIFENYPNDHGEPEFEWYNTVLQPWLVEFCKSE